MSAFLCFGLTACVTSQPTLSTVGADVSSNADAGQDSVGDAAAITPTDQDGSGDAAIGETTDLQVESDGTDAIEPQDTGTDAVQPQDIADNGPIDVPPSDGADQTDGTGDAPDAAESDTPGSDSAGSDTAAPDVTGPDAVPDANGSDAASPDVSPDVPPDIAAADTAGPDTTGPDTTNPDTTGPDTAPGCKLAGDCDDGNGCTTDICKADGSCDHSPLAGCVPPLKPCDSQNKCTSGVCHPGSNACVECLVTADCGGSGKLCQGNLCKPAQQCKSDVECKSLNKVCNKTAAVCVDCNGSNDCGANEACIDSQCIPAAPCKSSKDCAKVCNAQKAVCVECNSADDCAAGQFCDGNGSCKSAVCLGPACGGSSWNFACKADGSGYQPATSCEDGNPCTTSACDNAKGCIQVANSQPCDDASLCSTGDTCKDGACVGKAVDCNDGNPCTDDSCDPKIGCKYATNTKVCDDASNCTTADKCIGGVCKGVGLNCDDGNPCTNDNCDTQQACIHAANSGPCQDGSACTENDACKDGKCVPGAAKVCNDSNVCTTDSCDPAGGCKFVASSGAKCDDGNACTFTDTCSAVGACIGAAGNCDDGNPCTNDGCDPKVGCTFPANTAACDDKNPCTDKDTCGGGKCVAGTAAKCDDGNACTDQVCDPTKGGCVFTSNSAACEDGNACTMGDKCVSAKCVSGSLLACDDKNGCTADSCDAVKGCTFAPTNACDDKNPCTSDTCNTLNGSCTNAVIAGCCEVGKVLYQQTFDNGPPAELATANASGLAKKGWQVWDPSDLAKSGKGALYFGDTYTKNYEFAKEGVSVATLNLSPLPPTGAKTLKLQIALDIEKYLEYDKVWITIEASGKAAVTVWDKSKIGANSKCGTGSTLNCVEFTASSWYLVEIPWPAGYNQNAAIKFHFDAVDTNYNTTKGVFIDDIQVLQATCN